MIEVILVAPNVGYIEAGVSMDELWGEKIQAYRDSMKGPKPDLDIALLFRILDIVNESSEVKVAVNPVDAEGGWTSNAPTWAVKGVCRLDDGRVVLQVTGEHHGIEAGILYTKLRAEFKRETGEKVPVLFLHKDEVTQLTDVYSHALVREHWAGMPFDVVLAVKMCQSSDD